MMANYMASRLIDAIKTTIPFAKKVMDFLAAAAQPLVDVGADIEWFTPTGFHVVNRYRKYSARKLRTILGDINIAKATKVVDKRKQKAGISPNFIHSLDASHLTMFVNKWKERHRFISVIHDSFGFHACDVDEADKMIRSTFVEINKRDLLQDFADGIKLYNKGMELKLIMPTMPKRGNLDIASVLDSEYFFS
jgi:DNA-directed RNA polymerase